jgi:hypothetical protein
LTCDITRTLQLLLQHTCKALITTGLVSSIALAFVEYFIQIQ